MSQPTPYQRGYSFRNFQTAFPTTPLPGDKVDIEYNNIRITLDQVLANLALIQRDDGRLANSSVGVAQMDGALISLGFERPTNWATATAYVVDGAVFQNNKLYICLVAHTSGTFATDLANGKWIETIDFTSLITDAAAEADAAAASAAAALASQLAAATSASDAAISFAACLLKDGSQAMTGALTLVAGTTALHAATIGQAQSLVHSHATTVGGTADAITLAFTPAVTAYTNKMRIRWTSAGANTSATPTVEIGGGGAKTIKKGAGVALVAGDTGAAGYICEAIYNGTDFILLNPVLSAATTSLAGIVELATSAETITGTDTARATTPAGVAAARTVVQVVSVQSGSNLTGTTIMPLDNTIPQQTEGDEYMTLAITPTNASGRLRIDVVAQFTMSAALFCVGALFKDAAANAIAAGISSSSATAEPNVICFTHTMVAGGTSATTFKVRCGPSTAGTFRFNSTGSLGGVIASSIIITELAP